MAAAKKTWWNKDTDQAIREFTKMKAGPERDALYTKAIHPALRGLCAAFWYKASPWYRLFPQEQFISEFTVPLYEHLCKFQDKTTTSSMFTYFWIELKHTVHQRKMKFYDEGEGNKAFTDSMEKYEVKNSNTYILQPKELTNSPDYDSQIDIKGAIGEIINSISANVDNLKVRASVQEAVGCILIHYLTHTPPDQIDRSDILALLKEKYPDMSPQRRTNLLRHYFQPIVKKKRQLLQLAKGITYGQKGYDKRKAKAS